MAKLSEDSELSYLFFQKVFEEYTKLLMKNQEKGVEGGSEILNENFFDLSNLAEVPITKEVMSEAIAFRIGNIMSQVKTTMLNPVLTAEIGWSEQDVEERMLMVSWMDGYLFRGLIDEEAGKSWQTKRSNEPG